MVANWVRMVFWPRSFNCCSFKPCPESPNCSTGTLEALYWMMKGGVVPGGSERNWTWLIDGHLGHRVADVHVRVEEDLDDRRCR